MVGGVGGRAARLRCAAEWRNLARISARKVMGTGGQRGADGSRECEKAALTGLARQRAQLSACWRPVRQRRGVGWC